MSNDIINHPELSNQETELVRKNILNKPWLTPITIEVIKKAIITKVTDNIFSYNKDWKNIRYFCDKDWEILFESLNTLRTFPNIKAVFQMISIKEIDNWWIFEMYKIEKGKHWEVKERVVNMNTLEYYKIWDDVAFYVNHSMFQAWKENDDRINSTRENIDDDIMLWLKWKWLRTKDLLLYMKSWEKDQEKYKKVIKQLWDILPWQCLDMRFDKLWNPITSNPKTRKWELEFYLDNWYISKDIYDKCIENLKRKQNDKNEIHAQTKIGVSEVWLA